MTRMRYGGTRVGLVPCSRTKLNRPAPAQQLYSSTLFQAGAAYVSATCDRWFVVSALHHLVKPEQVIAPYDFQVHQIMPTRRPAWAERVARQLVEELDNVGVVVLVDLCGQSYDQVAEVACEIRLGTTREQPLTGLGVGQRLLWLRTNTPGQVQS